MHYQIKRDRISLMFGVILIVIGSTAAGAADRMIEDNLLSTIAIIAVCVVLLVLDRGFRWVLSAWLNKEAEKNGDPKPFDKNTMF